MHNLSRSVFMGAAPAPVVPVATRERDSDGDGVPDSRDACPGTPQGARVDARGCWVIPGLRFASDRADIEPRYQAQLDEVARVLRRNPEIRVRIDGHSDGAPHPETHVVPPGRGGGLHGRSGSRTGR